MLVGTVPDSGVFAKLMSGAWYAHPKLSEPGMAVLRRDKFSCQSCGFKSRPSKQVPHGWMVPVCSKNAGRLPVNIESSKTYCPFCASAMALNWSTVAQIKSGSELPAPGMLISLPQMDQVEVNRLALFIVSKLSAMSISNRSAEEAVAVSINDAMKGRQSNLETDLEPYTEGRDSQFSKAVAMLPDDLYNNRGQVIGMVRWWPNLAYWEEQGIYWNKATYTTRG